MVNPAVPAPAPLLVGWRERLDFPDWGINGVIAKVDTGATSSALDVESCELTTGSDGRVLAHIRLALDRPLSTQGRLVEAPVVRTTVVKNTAGMRERRPVIEVSVRLGSSLKRIQMTLTNRSSMTFRVILGREALRNDFIVDVSKEFLLSAQEVG
jgi:hypothetical protein